MTAAARRRPALVRLAVVCLSLLALAVPGAHADTIVLDDTERLVRPNEKTLFFVDDQGTLSAQEVYSRVAEFRPFERGSRQVGRTGVIWLLLRLENRTEMTEWIVTNTMNVALMELFERDAERWSLVDASGNAVPFAERRVSSRYPAFRVDLPRGDVRAILLRVADKQSSSIQLEISEARHFWNSYRNQTLLLGLAFGFFAALIVYNAVVFLVNRDPAYLVYSLYMTAFAVNQLGQERLLAEYVLPNQPHGFFWFVVFGGLTAALGVEFFRRLIETPKTMHRTDRAMRATQIALGALVVAGFFAAGPLTADILNILSLVAMALILYALVVRIAKRDTLALVCLIGSLLYLAGTATEIVGVLLPIPVTAFMLNAQLYGALPQVLILAFALGTKTYRLQVEYNRVERQFRSELEERVRERTRELQIATRRLKEEAVTDELTGLFNRKELNRRSAELDKLLDRKRQVGEHYSVTVAYLDMDSFKQCNDSFGHGFGDDLLRRAADVLRRHIRGYDLAFRVGGDEFVIVMPETTLEEGRSLIERVRIAFAAAMPEQAPISVSAGLALIDETARLSVASAIDAADTALLASKEAGKNR
ncbi:MAG: GGDEF domain-containing protein, partial [Spirochaetaceae bacterium]